MTDIPKAVQPPRLTAMEMETLTAWEECSVGYGFGFNTVAAQCGTPRHNIRRAVRSLARKGMLEYCRALFWEDEPKIGAGYTLTQAGAEMLGAYYEKQERCTLAALKHRKDG